MYDILWTFISSRSSNPAATMVMLPVLFLISCCFSFASSFASPVLPAKRISDTFQRSMSTAATAEYPQEPTRRDARYGSNVAQYLVDIHDSRATFDFCGGMMFQLVLSDKLRNHLVEVATNKDNNGQPHIYDATKTRIHTMPNYDRSATADNVHMFHGREIRQVPIASGGMGFVLQLSLSNNDPEGWTPQEVQEYDGWGHDHGHGRTWRKGERLEREGFTNFRTTFGPDAFTLHHRFYFHFDRSNRMWLSAEDGCEGTPATTQQQ
jgi:hypothetical protein